MTMKIWNGIDRYAAVKPAAATLGNFDGVHLGHQSLLRSVVDRVKGRDEISLLITFDPHPLTVVAPRMRPSLIQSRGQKLEALEATGLDGVLILEFTEDLASLTGKEFFDDFLAENVPLAAVHVGHNFRFGRGRAGDLSLLRDIAARRGFDVVDVPAVVRDEIVVSSSAIREFIRIGDVESAGRMLGRPYALTGSVVPGDGRGRTLRVPTANLGTEAELFPRSGVYITETVVCAVRQPSVTNVGCRPTFQGTDLTVETHLLDFDGDLYDERMEVRFLARLRDEMTFSGPAELSDQIARDQAAAVAYHENARLASG